MIRRSIPQGRRTTKSAGRRGGRFSTMVLLTLLALTPILVMCLGPGWLMVEQQRSAAEQGQDGAPAEEWATAAKYQIADVRREDTGSVAALEEQGVVLITHPTTLRVIAASFPARKNLDDTTLKRLRAFEHCGCLDFHRSSITDEQLRYCCALPGLTRLNLTGTRVSDAGLVHLAGATRLTALHLGETNVSNDGLRHLAGIRNLRVLDLKGTRVTEEGLLDLQDLDDIRLVGLTEISDAGAEYLLGMKNLRRLDVYRNTMSDDTMRRLKQAKPSLVIVKLAEEG